MNKASYLWVSAILCFSVLTSEAYASTKPLFGELPHSASIRTTHSSVKPSGWLSISVSCVTLTGSECTGSMSIGSRHLPNGPIGAPDSVLLAIRHHFTLAAGATRPISLQLHSFAANELKQRGRMHVEVTVRLLDGSVAHEDVLLQRRR